MWRAAGLHIRSYFILDLHDIYDIYNLFSTMNIELEAINQWFRANKLCLNVNKTKYILFRPTATHIQSENVNIKINNEPVERIGNTMKNKSFKFLGIHMDENINWKAHINYICNKISRSNYIINKVKHILPKLCLLNYGLTLWGSSTFDFIECFTTTFLRAHPWLNWVDEDDDEDEVDLKEKPEDTRYIKKITSK